MARIPWWMWIGVGAGMYFIAYKAGESLKLFSYIGLFFIVVGVFKTLVAFMVGGKAKKAERAARDMRTHKFTCPRCRNIIASDYFFCPHCGTRLRF